MLELEGAPGVGRSTALAHLADVARTHDRHPLVVVGDDTLPTLPAATATDLNGKDACLGDLFRLVRGLARQLPEGRTPRFLNRIDAVALAASERGLSHLTLETAADDVILALVDEVTTQTPGRHS